MRSGRLLAEESPRVLLSMYHCQSLEEVFLKLSRKQGTDGQPQEAPVNISNNISLVSNKMLKTIISVLKRLETILCCVPCPRVNNNLTRMYFI